jgi:DNA replication protein DnaC
VAKGQTWEQYALAEGLGVDAWRANIHDLSLHAGISESLKAWAYNPSRTLYLWGPPGCGKTYAGYAILRQIWRPGRWIRCLEASRITDLGRQHGSSWLQETYGECEVLMVDDLGVGHPADWDQRYTYDLFEKRCQKCKLPTLVTSNVSREMIKKFVTERVSSRLVGEEYELITGDVR